MASSVLNFNQGYFRPSVSAVISASGTKTAAISCGGMALVGIVLPAAFTGTTLTFEVCDTLAGTYTPLYDSSNSLVSMTVAQGRAYAVDPKNFQGINFLKIVSGSTEGSARTIICSLKGL
jgi:hypothetical protein